ncbi:MAG: S1C family serine protease [Casimicrobiaceae bacterium]
MSARTMTWSRRLVVFGLVVAGPAVAVPAQAGRIETIERVKGSIVAVGTYERTRTPAFRFLGTGFAVDDGTRIVTNAHVVPRLLDPAQREALAILIPMPDKGDPNHVQVREAKEVAIDAGSDLALLRIAAPALPPLKLGRSADVREGQEIVFTGYPVGAVLGPHPATHRGIISSITPIAIPQPRAGELNAQSIHRLAAGPFPVFQLDATAYPGNSGSPLYDPETGEVIGIVNMVFVKTTKEAVLTQPSGITYAVPSSHLRDLLQRAR